ncbi:hypothetical protein A3Q56_02559 [Intoshia linei]|uniref:MICOS complex subunit MIC10 n=1 Tax=Intoshia linei TaxID=1819745 RepID=A0A177B7K5_9BILA|nr:hypothetical protein A3Q56_02559 [Intoshia linei]
MKELDKHTETSNDKTIDNKFTQYPVIKMSGEERFRHSMKCKLIATLITTGIGTGIGGLFSLILKRKRWPITLGFGIGLGMGLGRSNSNRIPPWFLNRMTKTEKNWKECESCKTDCDKK